MQVYISAATSQHMEQAPYGSQTTHDVIQTSYTRRGVGIGGIERFAVIEPACKRVCVCSRNSKNLNAPNIRILGFMYLRNGLLEIAEEPFVECLWACRNSSSKKATARNAVLPDQTRCTVKVPLGRMHIHTHTRLC